MKWFHCCECSSAFKYIHTIYGGICECVFDCQISRKYEKVGMRWSWRVPTLISKMPWWYQPKYLHFWNLVILVSLWPTLTSWDCQLLAEWSIIHDFSWLGLSLFRIEWVCWNDLVEAWQLIFLFYTLGKFAWNILYLIFFKYMIDFSGEVSVPRLLWYKTIIL